MGCVACCRGKMHSRPHKGNNEKASKAFEVIYADVWGPLSNSLQGHKYAVLLVDEATSYTWVNFTATKSQVGEVITSFIVHQERRANFIQTLRTDNGGEFTLHKGSYISIMEAKLDNEHSQPEQNERCGSCGF